MENKLINSVTKMTQQTGAAGMLVSDKDGLPMAKKGEINDLSSVGGLMVADAKSMFPRGCRPNKKNHYPIITLQGSDGSKTTVANKHGETVCIHFK